MTADIERSSQQPIQLFEPRRTKAGGRDRESVEPEKLSDLANKIAKSVPQGMDWEVTVEGSLEVGTGSFWPGATVGFKTSLTLKGKS